MVEIIDYSGDSGSFWLGIVGLWDFDSQICDYVARPTVDIFLKAMQGREGSHRLRRFSFSRLQDVIASTDVTNATLLLYLGVKLHDLYLGEHPMKTFANCCVDGCLVFPLRNDLLRVEKLTRDPEKDNSIQILYSC